MPSSGSPQQNEFAAGKLLYLLKVMRRADGVGGATAQFAQVIDRRTLAGEVLLRGQRSQHGHLRGPARDPRDLPHRGRA